MNISKRLDWAPVLLSGLCRLQRAAPCRQRSFHTPVDGRRILSSSLIHRISIVSGQMYSTQVDLDRGNMTTYQSAIMHLNSLQSNSLTILKMRESRGTMQEFNVSKTTEYLRLCGITVTAIDGLNVIHVSGTKGKGSTCAFVESILRKLGLKTGLYSSPHLVHARERIRINSRPISEDIFARHFFSVYNRLVECNGIEGEMPAYFKFLTLMAFEVFIAEKVDVAIVEVGIGGQYDCTNVIRNPVVCGVSTLDIDHTSLLGNTLAEIAWHKAGIFKKNIPAIATLSTPEAHAVMNQRAHAIVDGKGLCRGADLSFAPPFSHYRFPRDIAAGIAGEHQKTNIALALQIARMWLRRKGTEAKYFDDFAENQWLVGHGYSVPELFVDAIEQCRWPGRSHILEKKGRRWYLDGAHTPKSMEMCSTWFKSELRKVDPSGRKRILVFQCTADRNPSSFLPYLADIDFDYALFCPTVLQLSQDKASDLCNFNQSTVDQLAKSRQCRETWKELTKHKSLIFDCITSLVRWIETQPEAEGPVDVLVTGSLHLVGGVLSLVEPDFE